MRSAICSVTGFTVLAVFLLASAVCRQNPARPQVELRVAEYEVLAAYIAGDFTGQRGQERIGKGISNIVIVNVTRSDEPITDDKDKPIPWKKFSKTLRMEAPILKATTIDAFRAVNVQQALLRRSFHLPIDYELVDSSEISSIFDNGGEWPDYYRKYPGSQGVMTLSRVGFSADGKQALFYASNACGVKCGSGEYVVMEKRGSSWVIAKKIPIYAA